MDTYLLIESGGPHAGPGSERFVGDATRLVRDGEDVSLVLVEDGVVAAVPAVLPAVDAYLRQGGALWVDSFSLRQRSVDPADLLPGSRVVEMDDVARKLLESGVRAVWH
jgi:sulfur relay (sulfurtransferase) DsrF/TusC family protein